MEIKVEHIHMMLQAARQHVWNTMARLDQELATHMTLESTQPWAPSPGADITPRAGRIRTLQDELDRQRSLLSFLTDTISNSGNPNDRILLFQKYLAGDRSFLRPG